MRRMTRGHAWHGVVVLSALALPNSAWAAGGTVSGKVVFEGTPPPVKEIQFGAEKQCALGYQHPPTYEDVVVNSNGTLKWVLVHIVEDVPGGYPAPTEPFVFQQHGCIFVPHAGAVMVGQPVEVHNDDAVLHNVRAQSKLGQSFNIAQPVQGMKTTKKLLKPEIGILLKCDVHFWMTGYLHVLAHPFFAITGPDGAFTIKGLPPGTYTVEAWHGKLGTQTQSVTVAEGQAAPATFTFKAQ